MASAGQTVRDVLKQMPEGCTLEDIQYQLYLSQRMAKSRAAVAEGRVVSHQDVKSRLSKWLAK